MKPAVTILAVIGCSVAVQGASTFSRRQLADEISAPVDKCKALTDCKQCTEAGCAWGTEVTVSCDAGQCAEKSSNGSCSSYDQCPGLNTKLFCFKFAMNCPKDAVTSAPDTVVETSQEPLPTGLSAGSALPPPPGNVQVGSEPQPLELTTKPALLTTTIPVDPLPAPPTVTVDGADVKPPEISPILLNSPGAVIAPPTVDVPSIPAPEQIKPILVESPIAPTINTSAGITSLPDIQPIVGGTNLDLPPGVTVDASEIQPKVGTAPSVVSALPSVVSAPALPSVVSAPPKIDSAPKTPALTQIAKILTPNVLNPYVKFNPKSIASCPATKPTQGATCDLAPTVICNYEIDAKKRPKVIASCKGGIWIVNKKFYTK